MNATAETTVSITIQLRQINSTIGVLVAEYGAGVTEWRGEQIQEHMEFLANEQTRLIAELARIA